MVLLCQAKGEDEEKIRWERHSTDIRVLTLS
jgi:hypothetical protein